MRKKIIAGNWKMNKNLSESINLISGIKSGFPQNASAEVIVCPPFTSLETVHALIKDTPIHLGAQNMYFEDSGAFTGEISADMLKSVGCEFVILGHSERRHIFGETDETVNKKIQQAVNNGLNPIFCVGETLDERENGKEFEVIEKQITAGLAGVSAENFEKIVIAYEPVWAIGTGKTASPEQAQEIHKFIRGLVSKLYSPSHADNVRILYGGSVKPNNAADLLSQSDIDGALVGGACLQAESFTQIIEAAD